MRPLHWSRLPDVKVAGTIWLDADMPSEETAAGLDIEGVEAVFGITDTRGRGTSAENVETRGRAGSVGSKARKEQVQLIDTKRSNNISIALARIRMTDETIKAAVLDPVKHPLSPEQVSALLPVLPTAEELEAIREYTGDTESLGRVEKFFLTLSDIERLGPRLQALQATQMFAPQWETLFNEFKTVQTAAEQLRTSAAFKAVLSRALALGNYLNGSSARGGAYGFKLADLGKLVQVKSADATTTLLHYLARTHVERSPNAIEDLKVELNALSEAKDIPLTEKKGEVGKLASSLQLAQAQLAICEQTSDALAPLLAEFCGGAKEWLTQLQHESTAAEEMVKGLASWLAEKPNASTEDIFRPIADFVKALEKAQQDNVRDAEAERRKQVAAAAAAAGPPGKWSKAISASRLPAPPPGIGDKSMMTEIALKMAQRAERAAMATGSQKEELEARQKTLLGAASAKGAATAKMDGSLGANLVDAASTGAFYAQRRAGQNQ